MQTLPYDNLTALGKPKPYKEGGQAVKFETFSGFDDMTKALSFLQQFDTAFAGGNFTEASKVRKATTFLKGNARQWWTTLLLQGQAPSTWIYFKQIFASAWLSNEFEVDVMAEWHQLSAASCRDLEEYNHKFWKALLPVTSYKFVPLTEQIEKYCCGLPKKLRNYVTKTKVTNLTQLIEVANTGYGMLKGGNSGFKGSEQEDHKKKNSAKQPFVKRTPQASQGSGKDSKGKTPAKPNWKQGNKKEKQSERKTEEQKKALMAEGKCFKCEQPGHIAKNCPQNKRPADSEDKEDKKGKKPKPTAGLVPDMVGDRPTSDASELCRTWGKVRDHTALIFFDPGAKANFISPELADKLGIKAEEMGYSAEAGLACPGHTETVTPIIGKLRLQIQSYVDAEEFYIMPLDGCDALLGMPWMYRVHAMLDAYNKKIALETTSSTADSASLFGVCFSSSGPPIGLFVMNCLCIEAWFSQISIRCGGFISDNANGPKTIGDMTLINAGKILENNKTLAESSVPVGELSAGVITMHVLVKPSIKAAYYEGRSLLYPFQDQGSFYLVIKAICMV
ncbi:hypothetical protein L7F22_057193 [Adiantum nelumboides]|nr:hypothetical protein [Adiantum nelumboides]